MAAQPRWRKADEPSSFSGIKVLPPVENKSRVGTSVTTVPESQSTSAGLNLRIVQAKNAAVAQAQKDGATGSYRIFDSPFKDYLVRVNPHCQGTS
ncbi:hypothetical protein C1H46_012005 [Malus baccata]|uniref:Uncharacterized protein n=1 Tax=Malus baccata TaxID=106549 RepID=A0A540MU90_MALBA|nr:hypothetical protein C1H46_012005 [Malus baccata]